MFTFAAYKAKQQTYIACNNEIVCFAFRKSSIQTFSFQTKPLIYEENSQIQ